MRLFLDFLMFVVGLAGALVAVSAMRLGEGAAGFIQIPVILLVLAVFYLKESRLAALAAGLGLGMDLGSSYAFLTWVMILGGTTAIGWWLSRTVLTNRSLPSLMLLGAAMRIVYFVLEAVFSRLGEVFGGTVWYRFSGVRALTVVEAVGLELLALALVFFIHVRVRGERARMLTHL